MADQLVISLAGVFNEVQPPAYEASYCKPNSLAASQPHPLLYIQ